MNSAPRSGLGITFRVDGIGQFRVVRVHDEGPSDGKGIAPDDRLISINGVSVDGRSFDELASVIDAATGAWYTLNLGRQNGFGEIMLEVLVPNQNNLQDAVDQRTFQNTFENRTRESSNGRGVPLRGSSHHGQPVASSGPFEQLEIAVPRSQYLGLSIIFNELSGFCTISEIHDSGAFQSERLRVGDVIHKVDGDSMRGMVADEVALAIRGSQSSTVLFTVVRSQQQGSAPPARGQILTSTAQRPSQELPRSGGGSHMTGDLKDAILQRAASPDLSAGRGHVGLNCQRRDDGTFMVQSIAAGGPAGRDGNIHVGDTLMEVNGVSVLGHTPSQLQQRLLGPVGSHVHLRLVADHVNPREMQSKPSARVKEDEHLKSQVASQSLSVAPISTDMGESEVGGSLLQTLSELTAEDVAHQIRTNLIQKLSTDSVFDCLTVWLVHILLCASLFLGLSHTEMLEADVDLGKDHFGSRQPEATSGPYFYVFSPLALISVFGFMAGGLFAFLHFRFGRLASIFIFSRRSGLLCIALYGNPFVAVTTLLVYWHLSQLSCCDWVSSLDEPMLIVMLPGILGVLLYFLWSVALEMLIHSPIEARLREHLLPVRNLFKDAFLGALLIAGLVLLYFKLDDRLDAGWMVATSPMQAMLIVIFFTNYLDLIRFSCLPTWKHPSSSSARLALMGTVDSAAFELTGIFVFTTLDDPQSETDLPAHRILLIFVVSILAAIYTALLVYDIYSKCVCCCGAPKQQKSEKSTSLDWLQPLPVAVISSATRGRVALRVTWPSPDELDGKTPFASFRLELCAAAPSSVPASTRSTVLQSEEVPANLLWTEFYSTEQQVAVVEGLLPGCSYILRVTGRWNSVQDRVAMGPLVAIRIPDSSALGFVRPPQQTSRPPQQAAPEQSPVTSSKLFVSASLNPTRRPDPAAAVSRQHEIGAGMPAPLVLKAVRLAGQDYGGGLCAVFEWVQQRHFGSNILDLQLLSSTNPSVEPHGYMMVYAGPDASVRVYNIEPSSMYVARLRAGDIDGDEMATVVERCQLPFQTPSVEELLASDAPPLSPIRASYRSEFSSPAPLHQHLSPSPRRPHWLDDLHSSRSPLLVRGEDLDDSPYPDASLRRRLRDLQAVTHTDTVPLLPVEPRTTTMAASPVLLPNGMSQWVPLQHDPRRAPSPPPQYALPFPQDSPPPPYSPSPRRFDPPAQPVGVFAAPFPFGQAAFQPERNAHPIWL